VILLNDVVQIFALVQFNIDTGIVGDFANGCGVAFAFVDGYLVSQNMQVHGALQLASCSFQVSLGGEQEVHRVAALVDCTVQIFPLASNFDIGLVHPPAVFSWAFTAAKDERHDWQNFQGPAV
jgi:hypothetical protein